MPSTAIQYIAYDDDTREMFVTFVLAGKTYVCFGMPRDVYEDFRAAPSRGQFVNFYIRDRFLYREAASAG